MIYLFITGNAGNQLFQYAFVRRMMEITGDELTIDFRYILKGDRVHKAEDVLQYFHVRSYKKSLDGKYYPFQRFVYALLSRILPKRNSPKCGFHFRFLFRAAHLLEKMGVYFYDGDNYLEYGFSPPFTKNKFVRGFWECDRYFMDIQESIRKEFTPRYPLLKENEELYRRIGQTESICVTVRRFDKEEVNDNFYSCDAAYFYRGVEYIRRSYPKAEVCVFSDDIEWCRENLDFGPDTFYERGSDPIWEKLRLMYSCKHFVISNSTFSWWAQFLSVNKNKIVVAPAEWRRKGSTPIDIYEDGWIYLDEEGNTIQHL